MINYREKNASTYLAAQRRFARNQAYAQFKRLLVMLTVVVILGVIVFITY